MDTVAPADGTVIAFDRYGEEPPVITTAGAFNTRSTTEPLASQFTVLNDDRRGCGDSGDTPPYAVEREIDDIAALPGSARLPSRPGSRPQPRRHRAGDSRIPYRAPTSRPVTSSRPTYSFLVAHHSELVAPSSRMMSIRLSPTAQRVTCGTGSRRRWPSSRTATRRSKAKAFRRTGPPAVDSGPHGASEVKGELKWAGSL